MIPLPDFDIAEIAAQLVSQESESWHTAMSRLENLEEEEKTAVYRVAHPLAEENLKKAIASGDLALVGPALQQMAEVKIKLGDNTLTRSMLTDLILWEKRYSLYGITHLPVIANLFKELGDLSAAQNCMEDAVVGAHRAKIDGWTAHLVFDLALILGEQGNVSSACQRFAESLALEQSSYTSQPDREAKSYDGAVFLTYYECAALLLAHKQVLAAIPLLAAAQIIGQRIEETPEKYHKHVLFQSVLAQARALTDEARFAQAWEQGLTMTPEQIQEHIASV